MTTRDIQATVKELYGVDISPTPVSEVIPFLNHYVYNIPKERQEGILWLEKRAG
jgi:transposase-like protein